MTARRQAVAITVGVALSSVIVSPCLVTRAAFQDELAPHVIAQVVEQPGRTWSESHRIGARILEDGRIEQLEDGKWTEFGRLSRATVARFKRVTDVMTTTGTRRTDEPGFMDVGPIEYLVRNSAREVIVIGRRGARNSFLLQGGASSIIEVLDGFRTLTTISY